MDCCPLGSSVYRDSPGKKTGLCCHFLLRGIFPGIKTVSLVSPALADMLLTTSAISVGSVQSLSHVQLLVTPWAAARQASLSITNSWSLFKLTSIELVMPSNHLIPFSSCLQTFAASGSFPMSHFSHQVAKVLEFQLQHQFLQLIFKTDFIENWLV